MTLAAGGKVDAADVPKVRYIKKAVTESLASNITLQDDDDFVFTLEANKVYWVQAHLMATGPAAADVRVAWAISGGVAALANRHVEGPGPSTTSAVDGGFVRFSGSHALTTAIQYGTDGTNGSKIVEDFLVETTTSGTSGTLKLQWAQWATNATACTMNGASFVTITELAPA